MTANERALKAYHENPNRRIQMNAAARRLRSYRRDNHLCCKCATPLADSHSYCLSCRQKATERLRPKTDAQIQQARIRRNKWAMKNPERLRSAIGRWQIAHRDHLNALQRAARLQKRNDPKYIIETRLRARITKLLKSRARRATVSRLELLGCTPTEFVQHLESKFQNGMTWENRHLWHIDHIRPCASFDLTDPEQQRACFYYTNLQPLWAADNLKKWKRWSDFEGESNHAEEN